MNYTIVIHPYLQRWAVIDTHRPAPKRQRYPFTSYQAALESVIGLEQQQGETLPIDHPLHESLALHIEEWRAYTGTREARPIEGPAFTSKESWHPTHD